jgi:hypothetical protein
MNVKLPKLHSVTWAVNILTEAWWSLEEHTKGEHDDVVNLVIRIQME